MTPESHDALLAAARESLGKLPVQERSTALAALEKLAGTVGEMLARQEKVEEKRKYGEKQ